jgi:hypothetical protein
MSPTARFYLASACSAAIVASAFQAAKGPFMPSCTSRAQVPEPSSPRTHSVSMSYFPYSHEPDYYHEPPPFTNQRFKTRSSTHPLFSTTPEQILDSAVDAQVVFEQASAEEDDDWIPDRERARAGEIINFDPENPKSRPLRNAAAHPGDADGSRDNYFQNNPMNNPNINNPMPPNNINDEYQGRDVSQLHSQTRHMNEEYYAQRQSVRRPPPTPRRKGPSVYTPEEEELINAMGGRGRRNTQEFSGTRTPNGRVQGRQQQGQQFRGPPPVEREMFENPPFGSGDQYYREEGYLGDSTLKEISMDYSVPICYLADVVASWGVPVPIDPLGRLGDMVTGEQAFAMLEAIHTLDIAALHDRYSEDNLMNVCEYYDIDLKEAFDFAMRRGWALPFGVRTFLRVEQEDELLEALCEGY